MCRLLQALWLSAMFYAGYQLHELYAALPCVPLAGGGCSWI